MLKTPRFIYLKPVFDSIETDLGRVNVRYGFLVVIVALLFSLAEPVSTVLTSATPTLTIAWSAFSNPSPGTDVAFSVCQSGSVIYVLGVAEVHENDWSQRIEARSKSNGDLLFSWGYNPSSHPDGLYDCVIVSDKLIAVGVDLSVSSGVIAEFSLDLTLKRYLLDIEPGLTYTTVISDGVYIYVVGIDVDYDWDSKWRVEKRRVSDLELVARYISNPSNDTDWALGIGLNPVSRQIWVVGDNYSKDLWRIEILDLSLNLVKVVEPQIYGWATGIAFDENGHAYVVGSIGLAKFDVNGNLLKVVGGVDGADVLYINGYVLVAAAKRLGDKSVQALLVFDKELNPIREMVLDDKTPSRYGIRGMAYDGRYLYAVGADEPQDPGRWTIYAVSFYSGIPTPTTITLTTTKTMTVLDTVTMVVTATTTVTEATTEIATVTHSFPYTTTVVSMTTAVHTIPYTTTHTLTTTEFVVAPVTQTVRLVDYITTTSYSYITSYSTATITTTIENVIPLTVTATVTREEAFSGITLMSFVVAIFAALLSGVVYISARRGFAKPTQQKELKKKIEQQRAETRGRCPFCSNELPPRARFCPTCGAYLEIEEGTKVYIKDGEGGSSS